MGQQIRFSFSVGGPKVSTILSEGILAEKLGYDIVWIADHLTDIPPITAVFDAWTALAYIGARTSRIGLAPGVTDIQRVHPAKTASIVATLDNLTRGRGVLGIGAGEVMNVKPYGMRWETPERRIERFREYIKVIQSLWRSSYEHPVTFNGKYYTLSQAHLDLRPSRRPRPPIYVGAFASEQMLAAAGELADGWFSGALYTPAGLREKVEVIKRSANAARRMFDKFDVMASIPFIPVESSSSLRLAKKNLRRWLVLNKYMLRLIGEEDAYRSVSRKFQYQLITPSRTYARLLQEAVDGLPVSDDSLERAAREMMAIGSGERCIEVCDRFIRAGATHIHVSPFMADRRTYEFVARKVIPYFKSSNK